MASAAPNPKFSDVYRQIAIRLGNFRPNIQIETYIASGLTNGPTLLEGITFVPTNWQSLITTLRISKTLDGQQAFAEGKDPEKPAHWALDASMGATIGKGFREIWRPSLSNRPLSIDDLPGRHRPKWNVSSSARFGDDPSKSLDLSSLHFAVAPDRCNIHVDQTGFVMIGPTGEVVVDPDFAQHLVNELLWKSKATKILPDWFVEHTSMMLPSSSNEFSRVGITADLVTQKSFRVSVTGSCSIRGGFECAATVGIAGKFGGR